MDEMRNYDSTTLVDNVDTYSILRDVIRNLWAILLGAAAVAMIINMVSRASYESTYTTSATFVVTSQNTNSAVYSNLSAAQTMAENFTNILNSDILKTKVCMDLNMSYFDASTTASAVENTNLLTLTVTADSPQKAYNIIRSIMRCYGELTQYVSGNMVMQVLQEPQVPLGVDAAFNANRQTRKWFVYAFAALLLVFMFLSYQKNTIKSENDLVEKLDARALGMVYFERKRGLPFKKKNKDRLLVSSISAGFEYVERFKKISTMVVNAAQKNDAKTIVVTSVQPREGKSLASANIAITLAKQGYEVALLDGNLKNPALAGILGTSLKDVPDVAKVLTGAAKLSDALKYSKTYRLHLLLGGEGVPNSNDLLSSRAFAQLLAQLKSRMDYIIIDTPAMSQMADAETIAGQTDMSILVVGYDQVLADELNDSIDALRDSSPNLAGCILNQVHTLPGTRRATGGYGNYGMYGRYGRYGRRYGNYGGYGGYGAYGRYGAYGVYGRKLNSQAEEGDDQT